MENKNPAKTKVCKYHNNAINTNFYFVNSHGEESKYDYKVPKGVRIIMFCYSGAKLNVCHRFDKFNWMNILLNPDTSSNYCTFLSTISQYSSIRDHFCIYKEDDIIKNINLYTKEDDYFNEGVFRLPVKGFAYDKKDKSVVMSSKTLLSDVLVDDKMKELVKNAPNTRIKIDDKKLAELMRGNEEITIVKSFVRKIFEQMSLSNLIKSIRLHEPEFTILLMTCREGVKHKDISEGKKVNEELSDLFN